MSGPSASQEMLTVIANEIRKYFLAIYETSPYKLELSYFKRIRSELDNDIQMISNLKNLNLKRVNEIAVQENEHKSSFQAFYALFLCNCGLFTSAYNLLRDVYSHEPDYYESGYMIVGYPFESKSDLIMKLTTLNRISTEGYHLKRSRLELRTRKEFERNIQLLTSKEEFSRFNSENYYQILFFLLSSLVVLLTSPSKRDSSRLMNYLVQIKKQLDSFLSKQRDHIRIRLRQALKQIDQNNPVINDYMNKDNDTKNIIISKQLRKLFARPYMKNLEYVEMVNLQLINTILLVEKYLSTSINDFLETYWRQFIEEVNAAQNLIDVFSSEQILSQKDMMFFLLLKDIYSISEDFFGLYEKISYLLNKCNKKEFALIQQTRFNFYRRSKEYSALSEETMSFIRGILNIINEPYTISDLKLMRKMEIDVCKDLINYWIFPLKARKTYDFTQRIFKNLVLDFFREEDVLVSAKLTACFYITKYIPKKLKDDIVDEILDRIFEIITLLVDKRSEKEFVNICVESQKIIQFFTEKEARVLESAKLIESVWKDDDILKNIETYLRNIDKKEESRKNEWT